MIDNNKPYKEFTLAEKVDVAFYNPPQNPTPLRCGDQGNKKNKKNA